MISLDTNVLVRFLVKDDENQYQTVLNFLIGLENKNAKPTFLYWWFWK